MFIKLTIARLNDKDKDIQFPSLVNTDDIKKVYIDPGTNGVLIVYKTYNEIGEEEDAVQEDMKTVASRLTAAGLYKAEQ